MPPGGPDPEFYNNLGVASAVFLALSFGARLAVSLGTIYSKYSEISGLKEWLWVLLGTAVSIVHPWNGALVCCMDFTQAELGLTNVDADHESRFW